MNKIIYKLGLISSSILILYALYGSIFVKGKTLFKGKTLISLFMAVIVIMFTIAFIVLLYFQMRKFKPKNFLIIASGLALIIRVFSLMSV